MKDLEARFANGMYNWAKSEVGRELREDFRILRMVGTTDARAWVAVLSDKPVEEARALMRALVKWGNPDGAAQCGEPLCQDDERCVRAVRTTVRQIAERVRTPTERPLAGRRLKSVINRQMKSGLGSTMDEGGRVEILVKGVPIVTVVSIVSGGVAYHHNVGFKEEFFCAEHLSVMRWMGLSGGTQWGWLTMDADAEQVGDAIVELTRHFVAAMEVIL